MCPGYWCLIRSPYLAENIRVLTIVAMLEYIYEWRGVLIYQETPDISAVVKELIHNRLPLDVRTIAA